MSFRIAAPMMTIGGLPAAWSRAWTARIVGFQRSAVIAGM
jgi:hypothetical protein